MVVSPFGLLEMEVEGVFRQALELGQPALGQAPEAFDAVEMDGAFGELVAGMVDADVAIAEVDPAVPRQPSELMTVRGSTRPRMMPWRVGFEQSGTISV